MKVSLHLIENIFGGSSQKNGTGCWVLALNKIGEIVITNFPDIKKTAFSPNIWLLNFLRSIDNFSTWDSGYSDVVCFSYSSDTWNVSFEEEMLSQIREALLSDNNIRFPLQDVIAHHCDLLSLLIKGFTHSVFSFQLHVGLTLAFLVFEWTVQKNYSWVFDASSHLWVGDVFVYHDSV